jgi:hypothetical protein
MSPMQQMQEMSLQGMPMTCNQDNGVDWQASPSPGSPGSLPPWGPLPGMQGGLMQQMVAVGSSTSVMSSTPDNAIAKPPGALTLPGAAMAVGNTSLPSAIGERSPLLAIAMPQAAGHALSNEQIAEMLQAAAGVGVYED